MALEVLIIEPATDPSTEPQYNSLAAKGNPDIFNFYLFLRKHPLIKRRHFRHTDQHEYKAKIIKKQTRHPRLTRQQSITDDVFVDDPLTPMERQLFFKTAHAHFNSGCPALALQVLMELPATDMSPKSSLVIKQPTLIEESGIPSDVTDGMINTGTLGDFDFNKKQKDNEIRNSPAVNGESAEDFDWSQPVSSKLGGTGLGDSSEDFDWSQPVSSKLGGTGLGDSSEDFDWSQPVSSKLGGTGLGNSSEDFDWSQPVSSKLGGTGLGDSSEDFDWSQPVSSKLTENDLDDITSWGSPIDANPYLNGESGSAPAKEDPDEPDVTEAAATKSKEIRHIDVIAQQMKFSAILKMLLDELHGLPAACEIADEDLRSFFMRWMEMEFAVLHKMADYGTKANEVEIDEPAPDTSPETGSACNKMMMMMDDDDARCWL